MGFGLLAACALASPAWADVPREPLRLEYARDAGAVRCPDDQEVRDAITARVRGQGFDGASPTRLVVRAQGDGTRHAGSAELRDGAGALLWSVAVGPLAQDCAAVMDALALSIAIKLGPPRRAPAQAGGRLFGVEGESAAAPIEPDGVAPAVARAPLRFRVGAGAALELATAPGLALGLSLDVGLRWPSFSLSLEGRAVLPSSGTVTGGTEVTTSRFTGAVVPCGHFFGYLIVCGLVTVGATRGTSNAQHPQSGAAAYAATGARVGVEVPLTSHLALRFALDGMGVLARPVLRIDGRNVWTAPPASASAGGGLVASF